MQEYTTLFIREYVKSKTILNKNLGFGQRYTEWDFNDFEEFNFNKLKLDDLLGSVKGPYDNVNEKNYVSPYVMSNNFFNEIYIYIILKYIERITGKDLNLVNYHNFFISKHNGEYKGFVVMDRLAGDLSKYIRFNIKNLQKINNNNIYVDFIKSVINTVFPCFDILKKKRLLFNHTDMKVENIFYDRKKLSEEKFLEVVKKYEILDLYCDNSDVIPDNYEQVKNDKFVEFINNKKRIVNDKKDEFTFSILTQGLIELQHKINKYERNLFDALEKDYNDIIISDNNIEKYNIKIVESANHNLIWPGMKEEYLLELTNTEKATNVMKKEIIELNNDKNSLNNELNELKNPKNKGFIGNIFGSKEMPQSERNNKIKEIENKMNDIIQQIEQKNNSIKENEGIINTIKESIKKGDNSLKTTKEINQYKTEIVNEKEKSKKIEQMFKEKLNKHRGLSELYHQYKETEQELGIIDKNIITEIILIAKKQNIVNVYNITFRRNEQNNMMMVYDLMEYKIADYDKCSITWNGVRFFNNYYTSHSQWLFDPNNYTAKYIGAHFVGDKKNYYEPVVANILPYEAIAMRYIPTPFYLPWDYQSLLISFCAHCASNNILENKEFEKICKKYIGDQNYRNENDSGSWKLIPDLYISYNFQLSADKYKYNGDYTKMMEPLRISSTKRVFKYDDVVAKSLIKINNFKNIVTKLVLVSVGGYIGYDYKLALSLPFVINVINTKPGIFSSSVIYRLDKSETKKNIINFCQLLNKKQEFKYCDKIETINFESKNILFNGNRYFNYEGALIVRTNRYTQSGTAFEFANCAKTYYITPSAEYNHTINCIRTYLPQIINKL